MAVFSKKDHSSVTVPDINLGDGLWVRELKSIFSIRPFLRKETGSLHNSLIFINPKVVVQASSIFINPIVVVQASSILLIICATH